MFNLLQALYYQQLFRFFSSLIYFFVQRKLSPCRCFSQPLQRRGKRLLIINNSFFLAESLKAIFFKNEILANILTAQKQEQIRSHQSQNVSLIT